jgi:hypothetical protein
MLSLDIEAIVLLLATAAAGLVAAKQSMPATSTDHTKVQHTQGIYTTLAGTPF